MWREEVHDRLQDVKKMAKKSRKATLDPQPVAIVTSTTDSDSTSISDSSDTESPLKKSSRERKHHCYITALQQNDITCIEISSIEGGKTGSYRDTSASVAISATSASANISATPSTSATTIITTTSAASSSFVLCSSVCDACVSLPSTQAEKVTRKNRKKHH